MTIFVKNKHTLQIEEFKFKCCIGEKGSTKNKKEGDKKTPIGVFEIENLYFRKDRKNKPSTLLKCVEIKKNMVWCNDVKNKQNYNRLIKINRLTNYEILFRKDYKYDYFIPIMYNTNPTVIGKGSAIFIHLTKNYLGTAGCVALNRKDFKILIKIINKDTKIKIF